MADLRRIVASIAETAKKCCVQVVTGDTKVVERGKGDGIYINTAGIGTLTWPGLSPKNIQEGDGAGQRHHWRSRHHRHAGPERYDGGGEPALRLYAPERAGESGSGVWRRGVAPTRGGVATTLNEFVENTP